MINNIYYLPPWVSAQTYVDLAKEQGLQVRMDVCGAHEPNPNRILRF